ESQYFFIQKPGQLQPLFIAQFCQLQTLRLLFGSQFFLQTHFSFQRKDQFFIITPGCEMLNFLIYLRKRASFSKYTCRKILTHIWKFFFKIAYKTDKPGGIVSIAGLLWSKKGRDKNENPDEGNV